MKNLNFIYILICSALLLLLQSSCSDPCEGVICENNGSCFEGSCACPDFFLGTACDSFDLTKVQEALNEGFTPKQLSDLGVDYYNFFGKTYEGGYIFHFDEETGKGLIAATEDLPVSAAYGCPSIEIPGITEYIQPYGIGASYTQFIVDACDEPNISARLCLDFVSNGKDDWFLPEILELISVQYFLADSDGDGIINGIDDPNNIGMFSPSIYGSSSQVEGKVATVDFSDGGINSGSAEKTDLLKIRPVRAF